MQKPAWCAILLAIVVSGPAHADWKAANDETRRAVAHPRVAAALAATVRMDEAILAHDVAGFSALFAEDAVVNNPFNKIARKADAARNLQTGLIDYTSLQRSIEYAALRGDHEVVLMGEERLTPVGKARYPGRVVRRRTTEVWSDESGAWKLAIRQATIFSAE